MRNFTETIVRNSVEYEVDSDNIVYIQHENDSFYRFGIYIEGEIIKDSI